MASYISHTFPVAHLNSLNFLLGEHEALETMFPPGSEPVQFKAYVNAEREECERFVRVDYVAKIPGLCTESFRALVTFSEEKDAFRLWAFSASQEEPLHMVGNFLGQDLVMVSDPWQMPWGLQRLRMTFTPLEHGGYQYLSEIWEPEGYSKYCAATFMPLEYLLSGT